jgi:predicted Zn-dependent peptidase
MAPSFRPARYFRAGLALGIVSFASACSRAVDTTPVDRTRSPVLPAPSDLKLPPITSKQLANGLRLMLVEHHELPVVNFIMLVGSGAETDPADRLGLATLTAAMLDEGAAGRDALAIADQAAFLGASLTTSSGWDASRISLQTITSQLDSAMALFADVVLRPSFPEKELDRLRRERLTTILQIQDSPPQIAEIAFARVIFGEQNPYGRPQLGLARTVEAISLEDVRGFYQRHYRPNNSTLIVVGDFNPADMERRIEKLFGSWEKADVPQPVFGPAPERTSTGIYIVDKPDAPQASVRIGHVGTARSTPDFFGLIVANTVLGGSFTSRLNMNLREARAFTYGASSRFDMRKSRGPFVARAEVFVAKTDSALTEFMKELNAIRDTIPAAELDKARQYLQLQLPDAFETTSDIASQLVQVALYGLPLDFYETFARNVGQVSQADAQRIMGTNVKPTSVAVVIVGDRRELEQRLRRLGLGPIELRDVNGAPIR